MNMPTHNESVHARVMDAIRHGKVQMRPRWHFVLMSALSILGVCIVALTLLYASSLVFFVLRESGVWFAPSFGMRGWFDLLRMVPWLLLGFVLVFLLVLELLVRRYAFVYKKPLVVSALSIVALVVVGGFLLAQTPLHPQLMREARRGGLPQPFSAMYAPPPAPPDVYHGRITSLTPDGFELFDEGTDSTTSVVLTPHTRLPYGSAFKVGDPVIVIGDMASGTVRAFGVRGIDDYPGPQQ